MRAPHDVTLLLADLSGGDRSAFDRMFPLVYDELRRIAGARLARERAGHTLATTELVHEAYVRLIDQTRASWQDRAHFFAVAAQVMRRVLIDWARAKQAQKRGNGVAPLSLDAEGVLELAADQAEELVVLDEALSRLGALNARQARVVECRYFAGLNIEETAEALGVSPTTVKQDWRLARTWLYRELRREFA